MDSAVKRHRTDDGSDFLLHQGIAWLISHLSACVPALWLLSPDTQDQESVSTHQRFTSDYWCRSFPFLKKSAGFFFSFSYDFLSAGLGQNQAEHMVTARKRERKEM